MSLPSFTSNGFEYVESPKPNWKYGEKLNASELGRNWLKGTKLGWKTVEPDKEDPRKIYGLLLSGIAPRPIALVSTVSPSGIENIAPFSWFSQVSSSPPVISISVSNSPMRTKDTVCNIRANPGFTVGIVSQAFIEQANICAMDAPEGISEWPLSGLTKEPSLYVKPPRVLECAFSMECELLQCVEVLKPETQQVATTLVLATVKCIHIRNDMFDQRGYVDPGKLRPVVRMGGITYATVDRGFQLPRFLWQETGKEVMAALEGERKVVEGDRKAIEGERNEARL